jgi:branched-chain amino acid transport system permease protein
MSQFLQQAINGLTLGSLYGLIAIGYTMVYGILGMINFAHGDIHMLGAFVSLTAFTLLAATGITFLPLVLLLVLLVAVVFTAGYGWAVERVAYRPLRGSTKLAPLISAIGASIFLQNAVQLLQGARIKHLAPMLPGGFELFEGSAASVRVSHVQVLVVAVTVVLLSAFTWMITRTSFGRQQRACEQDAGMTRMLGIHVDRTISLTFMIGAGLAGVAGMLVTLYYGVIDFYIGFLAGVKAFTAAVLGGIGSLPGAMLGGLLIGLVEAFYAGYFSAEYKDVAVFGILILVLVFRPFGLLGRPEVEKV